MKNSKKLLSLLLVFVLVLSTMTITSAATTNASKAKILHDLGLFNGISTTEYIPDLESESDAAQAIVLIGRALQWSVNENATVTFTDVPSYAVPYVAYAVDAGITVGVSTSKFGVENISGKRLVAWFLRALGYDMQDSWDKTELLATQAGLSVPTNALRDDVVGVIYAAMTTVPIGESNSLIQTIVGTNASKLAIAQNAGLIPEEYTILSTKMVGTKKVEIILNSPVDTSKTSITIKKGAALYSTTATWNDNKNEAVLTTNINLPAATYTATVNIDGEVLTKDFVVTAATASSIEVTSSSIDDQISEAQVDFLVKNQYGEDMSVKSSSSASDKFVVVAYNVTQNKSATVVTNTNDTYFEIDTLTSTDAFKVDDVVRLTVSYKGLTVQKNLVVKAVGAYNTFAFGEVELIDEDDTSLDEGDGSFIVDYVLVEDYGDVVDLSSTAAVATLPAMVQGIQFVSSDNSVVSGIRIINDSDGIGQIHFTVAGAGDAVITAIVTATGDVSTKSVKVLGTASPESVSIASPTKVVAGGDDAFDLALTILDQYGNKLTSVSGVTFSYTLDVADDNVTLTKSNTDNVPKLTVDLSNATVTEAEDTSTLKITARDSDGDSIGSLNISVEPNAEVTTVTSTSFSKIFEYDGASGASYTLTDDDITARDQYDRDITGTIALVSSDPSVISVSGQTLEAEAIGSTTVEVFVDSASIDVNISVIASSKVVSYSMSSVGKVYAVSPVNPAYQKEVTIEGVDTNGKNVILIDDIPDIVTTSDESKLTVAGNKLTGLDAGTVTISVWMSGTKVDSESVTVSEDLPYAVSVEFETLTINNGGDLNSIVKVVDQYGVELSPTLYFSENSSSYSISSGKNINGPTGYVEITVVTTNGLSVTKNIKVN